MNDDDGKSLLVPGNSSPSNLPHPLDGEWYVALDGQTYGPYTGHRIKELIADGRIAPETDVMRKGRSEWTDAIADRAFASLFAHLRPLPNARPVHPAAGPVSAGQGATIVQVTNTIGAAERTAVVLEDGPARPKSPGLALVLSILIVGVGQFYNGQIGKGLLMMVLCIGLWFVLLGWIINIWSWIDAYQTADRMNERYRTRLAAGLVR